MYYTFENGIKIPFIICLKDKILRFNRRCANSYTESLKYLIREVMKVSFKLLRSLFSLNLSIGSVEYQVTFQ